MSAPATCLDCGAGDTVFEGYCEECLDWQAEFSSQPEKPANTLDELIALRNAAHDRLEKLGGFDEYFGADMRDLRSVRDGDCTMPVARHLAVLAKLAAKREHETLAWLCDVATEAWREWRKWETGRRWDAQRKAS